MESKHEAAQAYTDAANAYKKTSIKGKSKFIIYLDCSMSWDY